MVLMHTRVWEPQHWSIKESGGVVAQSLSRVWLFATPWTAACQASLLFTVSGTLLRFLSTESVVLSNHLILCHPLLLPPSIFPSIRVFSSELALCIRWPKYWSFSFSISPPLNIQGWFLLGLTLKRRQIAESFLECYFVEHFPGDQRSFFCARKQE